MKFEYNETMFANLGLTVRHGNVQNIVFFWDEQPEAACYNLEIYRIDWRYKQEGFFREAEVMERKVRVHYCGEPVTDKCLSTDSPAIMAKQFAVTKWGDNNVCGDARSEVLFYEFEKAKPVCTVTVERNKFYHSVNDLPCGGYIVRLKAENRSGEIFAEAPPYYFHIDDAEAFVCGQVNRIIKSFR